MTPFSVLVRDKVYEITPIGVVALDSEATIRFKLNMKGGSVLSKFQISLDLLEDSKNATIDRYVEQEKELICTEIQKEIENLMESSFK